jgi:predicted ATPase
LVFLDEKVGFRRANTRQFRWDSLGAGHFESRLSEAEATNVTARSTRWLLNRMNYFHFHDTSAAAAIRGHSRAEDTRHLRSDGGNLAAYLLALKESDDADTRAAWQRVTGLIRKVAPFIKELSPTVQGNERRSVRLDWIDDRDEVFGPHHLSDGTLRAIALITALCQPPGGRRPLFLTIDEPELGLHPAAVTLFCGLVRSASPRIQILLATQSPVLLDHFAPEEVVVVERRDGASVFNRLDPTALSMWLEEYSLSDLYDKNVLGGRP